VKPRAVMNWAYRIFVGIHLGKHALGRQRKRWEYKRKMDCEDWKWMERALVFSVLNNLWDLVPHINY
jgi:hypothetical protein